MTSVQHDLETVWSSFRMHLDAHRPAEHPYARVTANTTPVCLLTGFLGSGKSHLLAHLLGDPAGLRVRALVNDIGSLPFDPTLLGTADTHRVQLTNGCGCCERTGDLSRDLAGMGDDDCDLIVLEGSGAGDPWALAQVIEAAPGVHLDRVVTVVSHHHVRDSLGEVGAPRAIVRQIGSADCIIVSHCDELSDEEREETIQRVSEFAPGRTVTLSSLATPASHVLTPAARRGTHPSLLHAAGQHEDLAVVTVAQVDEMSVAEWIGLVEAARPGLVRAKGRLLLDGRVHRVQVTPHTVTIEECAAATGANAVTLIGSTADCLELLAQRIRGTEPVRQTSYGSPSPDLA